MKSFRICGEVVRWCYVVINTSPSQHLNTSPSQHLTISTSYFTTMARTL
ncbi:MAG: hypothetical protein SOY53_03140 [Prevotella sp.]|nr:hypothetical protein [Leyella stercorea]MDY4088417.1 hypothetical protein [Prevotella sp.]